MEKLNTNEIGRREFLGSAAAALMAGAAAQLIGCGEAPISPAPVADNVPTPQGGTTDPGFPIPQQGGAPIPKPARPAAPDRVATISNNHDHVAVVTTAQQNAGAAVSLNIRGGSGHGHTVALSAADIVNIRDGKSVEVSSSAGGGHTHRVAWATVSSIIRDPYLG